MPSLNLHMKAIRSKVIECKIEKKCTSVKQLYLFICKHISFQAKFCMLIVISLKNIEKMFFITKCSYVDFKMGSKVIKCNKRSIFTNCVSFFFSGLTTRFFLNSKKSRSL